MKKRLLSAILTMVMMLTVAPIASAAENTDGWYDELVQSEAYKNYGTPPWDGATYGDYAYSLLDIDQNGLPELILRAYNQDQLGTAWPWYTVFTYDAAQEQVVFVGDLYPYDDISYSASEKAIAYSPTKPSVYGYGTQFDVLAQQELQSLFYLGCWSDGQGNDTYHRTDTLGSDEEEIISKLEYDHYLDGLTEITFNAIAKYVPAEPIILGQFHDVPENAWYHDAVQYVYENNLMNGTSGTRFSPDDYTSRAMLVTILYRMAGEPDAGNPIFSDIPGNAYYAEAVAWASARGIVTGVSSNSFAPDDPVTREQMATFLCRYAAYQGINTETTNELTEFVDRDEIGDYAIEAMGWACDQGLIMGKSSTMLEPKDYATRAEVALVLTRYCEMF